MTDKSSFASRWSKRKQAVLEEEKAAEVVVEVVETAEVEPERSDAEILEEFGLPDPDKMVEGDDFSGFMNSAVPAHLRNRALRKLWTGNAALANLDGLLDYGDDFTAAGSITENITTAYKVGKGYFDKLVDEDDALEEGVDLEDETDSDIDNDTPKIDPSAKVESVRMPGTKPDLTPLATEARSVEVVEVSAKPSAVTRKRMNFRF